MTTGCVCVLLAAGAGGLPVAAGVQLRVGADYTSYISSAVTQQSASLGCSGLAGFHLPQMRKLLKQTCRHTRLRGNWSVKKKCNADACCHGD